MAGAPVSDNTKFSHVAEIFYFDDNNNDFVSKVNFLTNIVYSLKLTHVYAGPPYGAGPNLIKLVK